MREFTKEEISLCKQIADKHRKPIKAGDYLYHTYTGCVRFYVEGLSNIGTIPRIEELKKVKPITAHYAIPLWTISDCLEWLMTKGTDCGVFYDFKDEIWKGYLTIIDQNIIDTKGKTPLEACLRAVLAVLEESK